MPNDFTNFIRNIFCVIFMRVTNNIKILAAILYNLFILPKYVNLVFCKYTC